MDRRRRPKSYPIGSGTACQVFSRPLRFVTPRGKSVRTIAGYCLSLGLVLAFSSIRANAVTDATHLYDLATLEQEAPRYRTSTEKTLQFAKGAMGSDELAKLSTVRLDLPLFARADEVGEYRNL